MEMKAYPKGARENVLYLSFCNIAVDSLYEMFKLKRTIEKKEYFWTECSKEYFRMDDIVNVAVVFSAMTIESLLNDFAATCLGDSDFYDSFEKLSALGKLDLISKFILHTPIEKSGALYCHMKLLFRRRDSLVHNKSRAIIYDGRFFSDPEPDICNNADEKIDRKDISLLYRAAVDSLKTVKEVAEHLTCDGFSYNITSILFRTTYLQYGNDEENEKLRFIHKALGLKEMIL